MEVIIATILYIVFALWLIWRFDERQRRYESKVEVLRDGLAEIAGQATPGANATVKRMKRIADQAMVDSMRGSVS